MVLAAPQKTYGWYAGRSTIRRHISDAQLAIETWLTGLKQNCYAALYETGHLTLSVTAIHISDGYQVRKMNDTLKYTDVSSVDKPVKRCEDCQHI